MAVFTSLSSGVKAVEICSVEPASKAGKADTICGGNDKTIAPATRRVLPFVEISRTRAR